jgi:hypothetical protein
LVVFLQSSLTQTLPAPSSHPKTSKGPRALGLLEIPPKGKAHLIPITILIDGKYYDASAYKAAPVPMALWSDTVYEAMRTGVSLGLFTVTGALQAKDPNKGMEWIAEGNWQTAGEVKAKAVKKIVPSIPRGMNDDEGPPVLLRRSTEKPKSTDSPAAPTTTAQSQPAPNSSPATTPPATTATPPAAPSSSPAAAASAQQAASDDQPPDDKDRPALKRGKAGAASAEEAQMKAAADTSAKAAGHAALTPANSSPASALQSGTQAVNQIQLVPAISDSSGPDPLPYTYSMKPEEEEKFRKKMLAIAADEIRARATAIGAPSASSPQSAHTPVQHGKATAAKPVQPTFEDVQLRVFDLADINEPELVLTANARMPQSTRKGESVSPNLQDLEYMITLVVREDVNGDLHKSLANVTDTQHLDVIPRIELIDAVDVDGDGRGELLFRQVSDAGSAFVIYRVIGDRLYPLFQGTPQ